jgi:hypothetical protein
VVTSVVFDPELPEAGAEVPDGSTTRLVVTSVLFDSVLPDPRTEVPNPKLTVAANTAARAASVQRSHRVRAGIAVRSFWTFRIYFPPARGEGRWENSEERMAISAARLTQRVPWLCVPLSREVCPFDCCNEMLVAFASHVNPDGPIDDAGNRAATEAVASIRYDHEDVCVTTGL